MVLQIVSDIADGLAIKHCFLSKPHLKELFCTHGELYKLEGFHADIGKRGVSAKFGLGSGDFDNEGDELAQRIPIRVVVLIWVRTLLLCLQLGTEVICHSAQCIGDWSVAVEK